MPDVTDTLAEYIVASKYEALPAAVRHEGVRAFVNWVGCAAGGSRDDTVERTLEVLAEFNGAGDVPPTECSPGLSMGGLVGGIGAAVAASKVPRLVDS